MKPEHERLLLTVLARQQAHAETPRPPAWQGSSRDTHDELTAHGPHYAAGEWWGQIPEHQRMRYRRAIDDLERDGYLETWARWGRKLSNIKLTAEGEKAARRLLVGQQTTAHRDAAARRSRQQFAAIEDIGDIPPVAPAEEPGA
jgi:hypothetical protein